MEKHWIIWGGGVFSWSFLWNLSQEKYPGKLKITLIDGSQWLAPCSLSSTAVVAARANLWGVSALGDLIQHSWNWWKFLVATNGWDEKIGVTAVALYHHRGSLEKKQRYFASLPHLGEDAVEPAYLIDVIKWMNNLKKQTQWNFSLNGISFNLIEDLVDEVDVQSAQLKLRTGKKLSGDYIIAQPGAYILEQKIPALVNLGTDLFGSFAQIDDVDWGEVSFVKAHGDYQLCYQAKDHRLLIGTYSHKSDDPHIEKKILEFINFAMSDGWKIPLDSIRAIKTGRRHKMSKRTPVIGKHEKLFFHLGGYKIGYLVSLFQSRQLLALVKQGG